MGAARRARVLSRGQRRECSRRSPSGHGAPRAVPAPSPAPNAANVPAGLLRDKGVQVGGAGDGRAPAGATPLATEESGPLADVVGQVLTQSDNLGAELLVKELGHRF